jgi:two-component system NtrC family sensor kinase
MRPGIRNLVLLSATAPAFVLVLAFLSLWFVRSQTARWTVFALFFLGLVLGAGLAALAIGRLSRRMAEIERQRDGFYQELSRLTKVASLGEVSSSIAHDLNNPLAIMNEEAGWCKDLLEGVGGEANPESVKQEFANSVEQILIQIARSREITRRILNWARDTDEKGATVDLNGLLSKTLYLLESDMQTMQVKVVKDLAPALPQASGSQSELRQVFLNLMKNALDAMRPAGGILTITTRPTGDGGSAVTIGDTGPGIPPEVLPRLFEPFFTTKPEGKGTGLGLSISHYIVRKLGGRLEVSSEPGRGSAFTVTLPAPGTPRAGRTRE